MSNDLIVLVEETLPLESPPVMAVLPSPSTGVPPLADSVMDDAYSSDGGHDVKSLLTLGREGLNMLLQHLICSYVVLIL